MKTLTKIEVSKMSFPDFKFLGRFEITFGEIQITIDNVASHILLKCKFSIVNYAINNWHFWFVVHPINNNNKNKVKI